jgi:hypothetical protein
MITDSEQEIKLVEKEPGNPYGGWWVYHPEDDEWNETEDEQEESHTTD